MRLVREPLMGQQTHYANDYSRYRRRRRCGLYFPHTAIPVVEKSNASQLTANRSDLETITCQLRILPPSSFLRLPSHALLSPESFLLRPFFPVGGCFMVSYMLLLIGSYPSDIQLVSTLAIS